MILNPDLGSGQKFGPPMEARCRSGEFCENVSGHGGALEDLGSVGIIWGPDVLCTRAGEVFQPLCTRVGFHICKNDNDYVALL